MRFSCEDVDDRLGDVEGALASAYRSLVKIRDWLTRGLSDEAPPGGLAAMAEDARAEAISQVGAA